METLVVPSRFCKFSDEDLLMNQEISVERLLGLGDYWDSLIDSLRKRFEAVRFNFRVMRSDYVSSSLKDYAKSHKRSVDEYMKKDFGEHEVYAVPDGLKGDFKDFIRELRGLLISIPFEDLLRETDAVITKLNRAKGKYSKAGTSQTEYYIYQDTNNYKERLDEYNTEIKEFSKKFLGAPLVRPKKAKDLFKSKSDFSESVKMAEDFDYYQHDLVHAQNKIKALNNKVEGIINGFAKAGGLSKEFKTRVGEYLIAVGTFIESYGVLVHESIRIDHNLVTSLKKNAA